MSALAAAQERTEPLALASTTKFIRTLIPSVFFQSSSRMRFGLVWFLGRVVELNAQSVPGSIAGERSPREP